MDAPRTAAARAGLDALGGLTWREPVRDDLPAIHAFLAEVDSFDQNPDRTSMARLGAYWDAPPSRPEDDLLLAHDAGGRLAALARAECSRNITEWRAATFLGAVRPDLRGRGIGRRIMAWQVAHARDWDAATREPDFGPLVLRLHVPEHQQDVRHLADRFGLHVVRHFYEMERPLTGVDGAIPEMAAPSGVRLADWDPARSLEAQAVLNAAFRDHWGQADTTEEMWQEMLAGHMFRAAWTVLAIDEASDAVVGVALNGAWEQEWTDGHRAGCTDELGVLSSHGGRGLARALLAESMRRFAADGMDAATLDLDVANPSGALGLYESLGYRPRVATCVHELVEEAASS